MQSCGRNPSGSRNGEGDAFGGELTCGGGSRAAGAAIRGDGDGNTEDQRGRVAEVKRGGGGPWNPCHE